MYILTGRDVWQSTRCDLLPGSRVLSITSNDPLDSADRMQTVTTVDQSDAAVTRFQSHLTVHSTAHAMNAKTLTLFHSSSYFLLSLLSISITNHHRHQPLPTTSTTFNTIYFLYPLNPQHTLLPLSTYKQLQCRRRFQQQICQNGASAPRTQRLSVAAMQHQSPRQCQRPPLAEATHRFKVPRTPRSPPYRRPSTISIAMTPWTLRIACNSLDLFTGATTSASIVCHQVKITHTSYSRTSSALC